VLAFFAVADHADEVSVVDLGRPPRSSLYPVGSSFLEAFGGLVKLLPAERSHTCAQQLLVLSVPAEVMLCQEATDGDHYDQRQADGDDFVGA
jgi:hypothetical protein